MRNTSLRLAHEHAWLGGVCAGIAYNLGIPTWVVRLLWVLINALGVGFPITVYILLWVFVPRWDNDPDDFLARTGE